METLTQRLFNTFGETFTRIAFSTLVAVSGLTSIALCCGLIYYEANISDRHRTLVNKFYSLLLSYVAFNVFSGSIGVIYATLLGSAPAAVCYGSAVGIISSLVAIFLVINESMLIKYLYCCAFKTVGFLHEDFWMCFVKVINAGLAFYTALFLLYGGMAPAHQTNACLGRENTQKNLMHQLCNGSYPLPLQYVVITLINYAWTKMNIRKFHPDPTPLSVMERLQSKAGKYLHSVGALVMFLCAFTVLFLIALFKEEENETIKDSGQRLLFERLFLMNIILGCGIPAYSYFTHSHIRVFFYRKFWM